MNLPLPHLAWLTHVSSYTAFILLAAGCYYFSISEGLFAWFFPDELAAAGMYKALGLFGCVENYYLNTTINRVGAALGVCLMADAAELFSTPFHGWVFVRLVFYVLIPVSIASLLNIMGRVPLFHRLGYALIISNVALFLISDNPFHMYGLDLAIYANATFTFFFLIALFPRIAESTLHFLLFGGLYLLHLNSHEAFLPISGFFIPLYIWYRYTPPFGTNWKKPVEVWIREIYRDPRVWILAAIYLMSARVTLLAPGVAMRQNIWPSSGTFLDGVLYALLSVEETTYVLGRSSLLVIILFLLGAIFRFSAASSYISRYKLLYGFLFIVPFAYLLLTGFLIGITPTLHMPSLIPDPYRFLGRLVENTPMSSKGAFAVRQNLFLYIGLAVNIFLIGFWVTERMFNQSNRLRIVYWYQERKVALAASCTLIATLLLLLHPAGANSIRILFYHLEGSLGFEDYAAAKNKKDASERLMQYIFPSLDFVDTAGIILYKKVQPYRYHYTLANLAADKHLKEHRGRFASSEFINMVYQNPDEMREKHNTWIIDAIYSIYGVVGLPEPCVTWSDKTAYDAACFNTAGEKQLMELLAGRVSGASAPIHLTNLSGVESKGSVSSCTQLSDLPVPGEHYAAAGNVHIPKGYHYFVFESLPTPTDRYIYLIGEKSSLLFPWLNRQNSGPWSKVQEGEGLAPIFVQSEVSSTLHRIKIIIESTVDQNIQIRWQHGLGSTTIYTGDGNSGSAICSALTGRIADAPAPH